MNKNISAGITARMLSEGIPDAQANGMSIDAGVQYSANLSPSRNNIKKKKKT